MSVEARYLEPELPDELDDAYAQTFDRLRRMFRARGCSAEEAADLAQEAAIRAFTHIRRWGVNGGGLDPLLNRIARNLLIDRYRRVTPHLVSLDSADELNDPTQDPTEEVERRQRRTAVQSAIRSLPVRHQKAIVFSLSGLSPEEVGKELGIGRNAADALLHRARRSLREHLAPVRDGMWGVAVGLKIRVDRVMRRAGIEAGGGADAGTSILVQSAVGIAAVAVVAAIGWVGAGQDPNRGNTIARVATLASTGVASGAKASAGSAAGSGSSLSGGSGSAGSSQFGTALTGGSWGSRRMDAHATVPGPKGDKERPLLGIGLTSYPDAGSDYSGPGAAVVNPAFRVACARVALGCGEGP